MIRDANLFPLSAGSGDVITCWILKSLSFTREGGDDENLYKRDKCSSILVTRSSWQGEKTIQERRRLTSKGKGNANKSAHHHKCLQGNLGNLGNSQISKFIYIHHVKVSACCPTQIDVSVILLSVM